MYANRNEKRSHLRLLLNKTAN